MQGGNTVARSAEGRRSNWERTAGPGQEGDELEARGDVCLAKDGGNLLGDRVLGDAAPVCDREIGLAAGDENRDTTLGGGQPDKDISFGCGEAQYQQRARAETHQMCRELCRPLIHTALMLRASRCGGGQRSAWDWCRAPHSGFSFGVVGARC